MLGPPSSSGSSSNSGSTPSTPLHQPQPQPQPPPQGGGPSSLPVLQPLDHYRLQLYNYAVQAERLRCQQQQQQQQFISPPPAGSGGGQYPPGSVAAAAAAAAAALCPAYPPAYHPRLALSMSLFHHRVFQPEEPKPQHSYIGLIAMAILSSPEHKLVLSDIYQYILDNYPYFRTRGPGWRNSIRHNLSLNDCFVKAGRSANGKGHYWAIHPANVDDFKKGDFRRRKAQRKVRKHMGLAVEDDGNDSNSPPPAGSLSPTPVAGLWTPTAVFPAAAAAAAFHHHHHHHHHHNIHQTEINLSATGVNHIAGSRKRQFDVASLLAPDDDAEEDVKEFPAADHRKSVKRDLDNDVDNKRPSPSPVLARSSKAVYSSGEEDSGEELDVVTHNNQNNNNQNNSSSSSSFIDKSSSPSPSILAMSALHHHNIGSSTPLWPLPLPSSIAAFHQQHPTNGCFPASAASVLPPVGGGHIDHTTNSLVARYYQNAARRLHLQRQHHHHHHNSLAGGGTSGNSENGNVNSSNNSHNNNNNNNDEGKEDQHINPSQSPSLEEDNT